MKRNSLLFLLLLFSHLLGISQSNILKGEISDTTQQKEMSLYRLGEIRVSSLRFQRLEREVAMPLVVVPGDLIPRQSSITLSDILANEPGLAVARDGIWSTSINIRGLGENRLVALVDGCRIETATDLAAGLSMIDPGEVERMEVIKGASSSIYGTGAMGGFLHHPGI